MKRLGRLLRSRRLALGTILALMAYVGLGTVLSEGAFASPVFLAIVAALTLETAACAIERTRRALAHMRTGTIERATVEALRTRPTFTFALPADRDAMDVVADVLGALRLKVTKGEVLAEGRSGTFAFLGSPVFHWCLVLLFTVAALGQLTRAEGLMGVVAGGERPDVAESYGALTVGPLHGDLSGLTIAVTEMAPSHIGNGVEQGPTPYVELRDEAGAVLAEGYVHANSPLRFRSMLIHRSAYGLAAVVRLGEGDAAITHDVLFDLDEADPVGVLPVELTVTGASGADVADVVLRVLPTQDGVERLSATYAPAGVPLESATATTSVLTAGDSVTLPGGVTLEVVRLTSYARLSVVDDWSVPVIYALFAVALIALMLAVLVPSRVVRVLIVRGEGGEFIAHVGVRRARADLAFPTRVERAFGAATIPDDGGTPLASS